MILKPLFCDNQSGSPGRSKPPCPCKTGRGKFYAAPGCQTLSRIQPDVPQKTQQLYYPVGGAFFPRFLSLASRPRFQLKAFRGQNARKNSPFVHTWVDWRRISDGKNVLRNYIEFAASRLAFPVLEKARRFQDKVHKGILTFFRKADKSV